jgi:hypothetical protein
MGDLTPAGHELDWAGDAAADILTTTARIAAAEGCHSVVFGWEVLDRVCLAREPRPRDTDRVQWFVKGIRIVKVRGHRPIETGFAGVGVVAPGGEHQKGIATAARNFLEQLGVDIDWGTGT